VAPFVNRERALSEIERLLVDDPSCRLLTLLGPGGAGKTRLAVQVVDRLADAYADGVHVISLGDTVAPPAIAADDWFITTIGEALGLSFQGDRDPQTQLYDYVRAKEALLVLDGAEHALSSADVVAGLLSEAPGLSILATSRERLGLEGERVWDVGGLGYPADGPSEWHASADEASGNERHSDSASGEIDQSAVRLFLESMERLAIDRPWSEAGRRAAVRICQLAEGLPLGLEMASAWARAMSLTDIAADIEYNLDALAALADAPPGHRALRAIFARSWALLSEAEQRVVATLSVFHGGFDREAAHSVAGASPFMLAALVDKALLRPRLCAQGCAQIFAAPRYEMHELVRQFVADELAAMPRVQEEARDKHCAYYSAYLGDRQAPLKGPAQGVAGDEIAAEINNVRAAWRWAVERARAAEIEQAMESLYLFYYGRGWIAEGRAAFEAAADALASKTTTAAPEASSTEGQGEETLVGRLLARQARFAHRLGQYPQARDLFQASLALYDRIEAAGAQSTDVPPALQRERAFGLFGLSAVFRSEGETGKAQQLLQRGLELYRGCDDRSGMAMTHKLLGIVHGSLGQVDEAQAQLKEALNLYQEVGDPSGTANTLNDLSIVAARRGRQALAVRLNRECLAIRRQNGNRWGVGTSLNNLGYLAYLSGEHKQAVEYLSEGLAIQREIGDRYHIANCLSNLGAAAAAMGERESASAYLHEALEIAFQIGARPLTLEVSAGIGALLAEDEGRDGERAAEVLTFVHDHPQTDKWTGEQVARSLAQLSARLAPDAWARAQARGRAGTLEAVVSSLLGQDRAA
jgi:predicted ATPase